MDEAVRTWADKRWAVVGFGREQAFKIMADIEAECGKTAVRKIQSKQELRTEFDDGTVLRWVRASNNSRGIKFGRIWCDKTINKEILDYIILPQYYGRREDIIWL